MSITALGFILVLTRGILLSRVIKIKLNNKDIFNKSNVPFAPSDAIFFCRPEIKRGCLFTFETPSPASTAGFGYGPSL
jgi:hypothetical protein